MACQPGIQCPTQGHFNMWRGCRIAHHKIHKQWCSYELLRSIYTASLGPHINLMISNYLERVLSYDLYRNSFFFNTTQIITRYPRSGSLSLLALYRNVLVELNKKNKNAHIYFADSPPNSSHLSLSGCMIGSFGTLGWSHLFYHLPTAHTCPRKRFCLGTSDQL